MFRWLTPGVDQAPQRPSSPADRSANVEVFTTADQICNRLDQLKERRNLLAVSLAGVDEIYSSTILEVVRAQRYLVLDELSPRIGNLAMIPRRGLLIRARLNNVTLQFHTEVDAAGQEGAASYYRVALPRELLQVQRREHFRACVPMERHVTVHLVSPEQHVVTAELRDISVGGFAASLRSGSPFLLTQGTVMERCVIALPDEQRLCGSAEVCYSGATKTGGAYRFGARFLQVDRRDFKRLEQFIAQMDREYKRKRLRR